MGIFTNVGVTGYFARCYYRERQRGRRKRRERGRRKKWKERFISFNVFSSRLCAEFHVAFALFALFPGCTRGNKRGDWKRRGSNSVGIDSGSGHAARCREIFVQTDRGANGHSDVDRRARLALNLLLKKEKKKDQFKIFIFLTFPTFSPFSLFPLSSLFTFIHIPTITTSYKFLIFDTARMIRFQRTRLRLRWKRSGGKSTIVVVCNVSA